MAALQVVVRYAGVGCLDPPAQQGLESPLTMAKGAKHKAMVKYINTCLEGQRASELAKWQSALPAMLSALGETNSPLPHEKKKASLGAERKQREPPVPPRAAVPSGDDA